MYVSSVHCAVVYTNRIEVNIRLIRTNDNIASSTYLHRVGKQVGELTSFNAVNVEVDEIKIVGVSIQYVSVLLRTNHECQTNTHTIVCIHRLHIRITLAASCEHNRRRLHLQTDITLLVRHSYRDTLCIVIRRVINLIVNFDCFTTLRCLLGEWLVINSKA